MTPGPVAIVLFGDMIDDYLGPLGLTFAGYAERVTGTWVFGLVDALASAGYPSMLVCVSRRFRHEVRVVHAPSGTEIVGLPSLRVPRPFRRSGLAARATNVLAPYLETPVIGLWRLLRAAKCSAVICQEYEHPRFDLTVAIGKLARVRVFAMFQAAAPSTSRVHRIGRRLAVRHCAGLLIADHGERERVLAAYPIAESKVAAVPNALDLSAWRPVEREQARRRTGIPLDDYVVAWHGRVELERKGLDVLVDACRRLGGMGLDRPVRLVLVGTGLQARELRELLGSADGFEVTWKDEYVVDPGELAAWLSAADVYAFPSRREGFAVAPLEAMACGVPVVATDVEGIRLALPDGEASGGVVVPRDDAVALAGQLHRMLADEGLRQRVGQAGQRRVAAFGVEAVGRQLAAVLSGPVPPPPASPSPPPTTRAGGAGRSP